MRRGTEDPRARWRFPSDRVPVANHGGLLGGRVCVWWLLADPVDQTDGATRIDICYEATGGANHQQN
jgi:hypothetical protein